MKLGVGTFTSRPPVSECAQFDLASSLPRDVVSSGNLGKSTLRDIA